MGIKPQFVTDAKTTICVVNYKTPELTRLCLRSIRKYTRVPFEMLVIDNHSEDASVEYLRSLRWIRLVEREDRTNDSSGGYAHAAALDLGLSMCETEFFLAMHSDTIVHRDGWLGELLAYFGEDERTACVGGGKCEDSSPVRALMKKVFDFKSLNRRVLRVPDPLGMHRYYNRTVCSLYRTEVLKKENLSFLMDRDKGLTVGKKLYFELVDRGYRTVELPDRVMSRYVWHLAHATQVLNAEEYNLRNRTQKKTKKRIEKIWNCPPVQAILREDLLDR